MRRCQWARDFQAPVVQTELPSGGSCRKGMLKIVSSTPHLIELERLRGRDDHEELEGLQPPG